MAEVTAGSVSVLKLPGLQINAAPILSISEIERINETTNTTVAIWNLNHPPAIKHAIEAAEVKTIAPLIYNPFDETIDPLDKVKGLEKKLVPDTQFGPGGPYRGELQESMCIYIVLTHISHR